jgi:DNA primase
MTSEEAIAEIKAKLPVEEVVGTYVALKKMGRVFKAPCPFHSEKTPSFTVNPERGIYKCFGCGKGGDIFSFIMEQEGVTFPEALQLLADRAGVSLPERDRTAPKESGKSKIASINQYLTKAWHTILTEHPKAAQAREYLHGRGLTDDSIKAFSIGYAPSQSVTEALLRRAGYTAQEQHLAGEPKKFADRIVFPIGDITGRIVAFTGRLLVHPDDPPDSANRGPKYWNSPETPLFIKSRTVFALHQAKRAIEAAGHAILVEGQMDVILLHQAGYQQTVASSGTALTKEQLELIRRFTHAVVIAYDADKAGQLATVKAIELALSCELTPYIVSLPSGTDPADLISSNPAAWEAAFSARTDHISWRIQKLAPNGVTSIPAENRREIARELVWFIALTPDPLERERAFPLVAAHLQAPESSVRELYNRMQTSTSTQARSSTPDPTPKTTPVAPVSDPASVAAALLFLEPKMRDVAGNTLGSSPTTHSALTTLVWSTANSAELTAALQQLDHDTLTTYTLEAEAIVSSLYADQELTDQWLATEVTTLLHHHRSNAREQVKQRLASDIRNAQLTGDTARLTQLVTELQQLL